MNITETTPADRTFRLDMTKTELWHLSNALVKAENPNVYSTQHAFAAWRAMKEEIYNALYK